MDTEKQLYKSVVFLAGTALDLIRRCRRHVHGVHGGERLKWVDILVTSAQCAGKYITYTRSLTVYTVQAIITRQAINIVTVNRNNTPKCFVAMSSIKPGQF